MNEEQLREQKERGNSFYRDRKFENAIDCFTTCIEHQPHGPESHFYFSNRALCYLMTQSYENALSDAESCISLKKDFVKGYVLKARALLQLDRHHDALQTVHKG